MDRQGKRELNKYQGDAWKTARIAYPNLEESFAQKVRDSIEQMDAQEVGQIAEALRDNGYTYMQSWQLFNNLTGISMPDYDELLYEADHSVT